MHCVAGALLSEQCLDGLAGGGHLVPGEAVTGAARRPPRRGGAVAELQGYIKYRARRIGNEIGSPRASGRFTPEPRAATSGGCC